MEREQRGGPFLVAILSSAVGAFVLRTLGANVAVWGVGVHPSIVTASLRAVVNSVNRALALRAAQTAALEAFGAV